MDIEEVRGGLEDFISAEIGTDAKLAELVESDGHAGLTFLFSVAHAGTTTPWVIKLPPKGVRRRGNTDVNRQAPLLRALKAAGLPVPDVPWSFEDNPFFEVPFIVMERLPGRTFFVWDPHPALPQDAAGCRPYWAQCAEWLARLHAFDWRAHLPAWEAPASLEREITRWQRIYAQAPEPGWAEAAAATERALLDSLPDGEPVGLFHGDYQPGNCLYDGDRLCGVIDWELSGIGAQLLDVGWLQMVADSAIWTPGWMPRHPP
ncbi:MAG: phosphotransferase family protein, partial [Gammaproteobacteria bacterium]